MGHYHLQEVISSNSMDPPNLHYILLAKITAFTVNYDAENTLQEYVASAAQLMNSLFRRPILS